MQFTARHLTPLLIAGAASAAVAFAPMASASIECADIGAATQCGSPGNSQITANVPQIQQPPQIIIIHRGHR